MALVLSRKVDESIVIAGNIIVTVASIQPGKVRLAITAPEDTTVHRCEIQDRIDADQPTYTDAVLSTFGCPPELIDAAEADAEAAAINRLTGHDPHECVYCHKVDCVCPSFVREDRNGKLHFDDAADALYRQQADTAVVPMAAIHAERTAAMGDA